VNSEDRIRRLLDWYGGDELAANVLADKYLLDDENSPEDMWHRLADAAANIEKDGDLWSRDFYSLLQDFKFIPGGRIMYALGRDEKVSCTNCYVVPHKEDSIEGIYDWLKESALTYRATGGVGTDISVLRPRGSAVKNSGGESPGACSFMDLMSRSTHTVHQKLRRGALMITMNIHHPDILEFITIKKILGQIKYVEGEDHGYNDLYKMVEHANISVHVTDEFLDALENDKKYEQRFPVDSPNPTVKKKVSAKKIWDAIVSNAHEHAEPGIFFIDNHRKNDALHYINPALTTNPCGEQFLGPYANCLLGHMNLAKYVNDTEDAAGIFNFARFADDIRVAVRFLDNCIDWNKGRHALPQQEETALNERRIGLGITGLGDAFIKMRIKYDSDEAINMIESIMSTYRDAAYEASVELAEEKGPFPWWTVEGWKSEFIARWMDAQGQELTDKVHQTGIRNSFLLTCAPVGSGSIIAQVSSGIEPLFATHYTRRVREQDGQKFKEYKTYPRIISERFMDDENLPDYIVTAHDIDPEYRIGLQAAIQRYVDNSISSTINLSKDTPIETVGEIYRLAWQSGLKSITVYRDGSREGVLIKNDDSPSVEEKPKGKPKRPIELRGVTYKIPSGSGDEKLYITINPSPHDPKKPFEIFISSYGKDNPELQTITVLLSALMKNADSVDFIIDDLRKIESSGTVVFWHDKDAGRRHQINSVPRAVAIALEKFTDEQQPEDSVPNSAIPAAELDNLQACPKCGDMSYVLENGCGHCINARCGYELCGG